jgi:hypothetical protein
MVAALGRPRVTGCGEYEIADAQILDAYLPSRGCHMGASDEAIASDEALRGDI